MTLTPFCKWGSENMGCVQYHTLMTKEVYCSDHPSREPAAKGGWWTSSSCHTFESTSSSNLEAMLTQGSSQPMTENDSGIREWVISAQSRCLWWVILLWGSSLPGWDYAGVWDSSYPALLPSCSPHRFQTCMVTWKLFTPTLFSSSFIVFGYLPKIKLLHA